MNTGPLADGSISEEDVVTLRAVCNYLRNNPWPSVEVNGEWAEKGRIYPKTTPSGE